MDPLRSERPLPLGRTDAGTDVWRCAQGHELTEADVVRHQDGRIACCRMCRNERRRDRYRTDPDFARHEIERQRQRRA